MKNSLGYSWFSRHLFNAKEYIKLQIPKIKNLLVSSKSGIDQFIEIYKTYGLMMLFISWLLVMLLCDKNVLLLNCVILIASILTILDRHISYKHEEFYLTTDFSKAIVELDSLIAESIQEYLVMNGMGDKNYFSTEDENKLREETTNLVSVKLSKPLYTKLCAAYNKDTVYNVIGSRIYMIVMKFVIETNLKPIESKKEKIEQQNIIGQMSNLM